MQTRNVYRSIEMVFSIKEKVSSDNPYIRALWLLISFIQNSFLALYMEPEWDCLDLLNAASQRMDMVPAAKRVFNADGK